MIYDIIIIGGGAAGFFTAINAAGNNPGLKTLILERGKEVLTKVRISGGGRCNVTHAEFLPQELVKKYPRGEKELRGPFHGFMTGDTIDWFQQRGVELKAEEDGRMFPVSDNSETIIQCFLDEVKRLKVEVQLNQPVKAIQKKEEVWVLSTGKTEFRSKKLLIATGSNPKIWQMLENIGHSIIPAVPSLFTFNIQDQRIKGLAGVSSEAIVKIRGEKLENSGPLLITHWGMSGPAILKLSAWGARELNRLNYQFEIQVNWLPNLSDEETLEQLKAFKFSNSKQQVGTYTKFDLPKRLWKSLVCASGISEELTWAAINKKQLQKLAAQLSSSIFKVEGKSTFKEEFVTAGGVDLKEINFKTFQSKFHDNLFLAGEVLNIDAITGGFNFQSAWTGGFLAAKAMS